jgi:hypothetical protein
MGNRANLVIVENGQWQLHYSHTTGCCMLDALAFGPDFALRYIRLHRRCPRDEWTDPPWADGGALVDVDARRLLFFGDELMTTMPERRAMLAVLAVTWPDYAVGWAYGGTDEIAAYVGAEPRRPIGRNGQPLKRARGRDGLCHVVSVIDEDGTLRLWPLWWGYSSAWQGPSMLKTLPGKGVTRMHRVTIPESGVHVDVPNRSVGVWTTSEARGLFDALDDRWPGWRTECWDDRYEEQVARFQGALRVPELDIANGIDSAKEWIRRRTKDAMTTPLQPDRASWNRFESACAQLRGLYTRSA